MTTRKQIWDWFDQVEGQPEGTTFANLNREFKRQGYCTGEHASIKDILACTECSKALESM